MKRILFAAIAFVLLAQPVQADWPEVLEEASLTPVVGGASNLNYQLHLDGADYFVRFAPKEGGALYADLGVEYEVLGQLSTLGLSAKPHYFDPAKRVLVTDFIQHTQEKIDLKDCMTRKELFRQLHRIEDSGLAISREFHPYQDILKLVQASERLGCPPLSDTFYELLLPALEKIDALLAKESRRSLCHLDLHSHNVIKAPDRLWIVDWEYATMSHPFLVLASMSAIEAWDDGEMQRLLDAYQDAPTSSDFYQLYLYRIVADLFWTVWNHVQAHVSPIAIAYSDWEEVYYNNALMRVNSLQLQ